MQSTGHSSTHVPEAMHSSVILLGMGKLLRIFVFKPILRDSSEFVNLFRDKVPQFRTIMLVGIKKRKRRVFAFSLHFVDCVHGTYFFTSAAIDASVFVDDVDVALGDAIYGAFLDARTASDAVFIDSSSHAITP